MKKAELKKHTIDAAGMPVGRVATQVALILRGKHKPSWRAHMDQGDAVEVANAEKMVFKGTKMDTKVYRTHSGRPGGLKETDLPAMLRKGRKGYEEIVKHAVKGMLPTTTMRTTMMKRLSFKHD